jgi:hypothetical protein
LPNGAAVSRLFQSNPTKARLEWHAGWDDMPEHVEHKKALISQGFFV